MNDPLFKLTKGEMEEPTVKKFLEELEHNNITHHNYLEYVQRAENMSVAISAQVQSLHTDYSSLSIEYKELFAEDKTKTTLENKVVPIELYKMLMEMFKNIKNIVSWKWYESEMYLIIVKKLSSALAEAKVVDNEREVLNRMQDMEQQRNKFLRDALVTSINTMHEKYTLSLERNTKAMSDAVLEVVKMTDDIVKQLAQKGIVIQNAKEYHDNIVKAVYEENKLRDEDVVNADMFKMPPQRKIEKKQVGREDFSPPTMPKDEDDEPEDVDGMDDV